MIDAPRSETCRGDRPLVQNAPRVLGLLRRGPQAGASADWPKRSVQASPEARLGGRVVMRAAPHCLTAHLQLVLVSALGRVTHTKQPAGGNRIRHAVPRAAPQIDHTTHERERRTTSAKYRPGPRRCQGGFGRAQRTCGHARRERLARRLPSEHPIPPCLRSRRALGRIPVGAVVHEHRELHECGRQAGAIKPLARHRDQTRLPGILAGLDGVDSSTRGVSLREVAKRLLKARVSHPHTIGRTGASTLLAPRHNRIRPRRSPTSGDAPVQRKGAGGCHRRLTALGWRRFSGEASGHAAEMLPTLALPTLALGTGVGIVGLIVIIVLIVLIIRIL